MLRYILALIVLLFLPVAAFASDIGVTDGPGGWIRDGRYIRTSNPATDVVVFGNTSGLPGGGGDADTLNGEVGSFYQDRVNHTGFQSASTISNFLDAVLETSLSTGVDSHTPGDDTLCKVTRNAGDITGIDIEVCTVHIQGKHYSFAAVTSLDVGFGGGESARWFGYSVSGLESQQAAFTDVQQRTTMVIARVQAKVGQTGPGSDISDTGIIDHRFLISEDGYRWSIYLDNAIGALFETGGLTTENAVTDRNLDLSAGTLWSSKRAKQTWGSFTNLSGLHVRHVGGVWSVEAITLNMDNVNYDNGTDLMAMTNNNYHCSNTLLMVPRGTQDADIDDLRIIWVHCQSEHSDLQGALDSGLDFGPFVDQPTSGLVPLAQVIVKKNTDNIISIIDARPRIGTAGGSITTASTTLQGAYNNSSPGSPEIVLNAAQDGFVIRDSVAGVPEGLLFQLEKGDGTPVFSVTTSFSLPNPTEYFLLRDVKPSGTQGGQGSAGNWVQRDLNEEAVDTGNFVNISSNSEFVAQPGNYYCGIYAHAYRTDPTQVLLRNKFDNTTSFIGMNAHSSSTAQSMVSVVAFGQFTTTVPRVYAVEQRVTSAPGSQDLGVAKSWGTPEIYTNIKCGVEERP